MREQIGVITRSVVTLQYIFSFALIVAGIIIDNKMMTIIIFGKHNAKAVPRGCDHPVCHLL